MTASSNASDPSLTLPASEQVTADGTVDVTAASYSDTFAENNAGSMFINISDSSGLLTAFYPGANGAQTSVSGGGTDSITFQGSYADVEAILNSLTYTATTSSGSDSINYDIWNQAGTETAGAVPVTIGGTVSSGGTVSPTLREPSSESVTTGGSIVVAGTYANSFAASNPGSMYLSISDTTGTLCAKYGQQNGQVVTHPLAPGSGTNAITFQGSYQQIEGILNNLTYVAGSGAGTDNIHFDIWDQQGVETTGNVPVTVTAGSSGGGGNEITWTGAVSSDWNTAGNWSSDTVPTNGDTVLIAVAKPNLATLSNAVLNGETILLQSSGFSSGQVDFNNVTLNSLVESSSGGAINIGGTLTIGAQGTVLAEAGGNLSLAGTGDVVVNNGLIASAPTGDVDIFDQQNQRANATLINNGTLDAGGRIGVDNNAQFGGLLPDWNMINSGSVTIGNGGLFLLNGTMAGGSVAFTGLGELGLQEPNGLQDGAVITGFGQGDVLALYGSEMGNLVGFNNGTLLVGTSGSMSAIPMSGSLALGNFQEAAGGSPGSPNIVAYAPGGGTSGIVGPGIVAPAEASVAQGATLALNDVSVVAQNGGTIDQAGTYYAQITASNGTLFMNGASGSGSGQVTLTSVSATQLNQDLASLSYVPSAGAASDTIRFYVNNGDPLESLRWLPVTVTGSGGPTLSEPASENVAQGGTVAVSGSYSDSFAQGHAGQLYLGITDSSGTLSATDASGQAVAGSGTNSISLSTDYVDLNAILASLHYTAGTSSGSDTISFDVWNQAGTEIAGSTSVTVAGAQNAAMTMADFASPGSGGSQTSSTSPSAGYMLPDTATQPIETPLALHLGT